MKKARREVVKAKKKIYLILFLVVLIIGIVSPKTLESINSVLAKTINTNQNTIASELSQNNENKTKELEESTQNYTFENTNISEKISKDIQIDKNKLNVLYLDVGQADSELILYKDKVVLIDTGNVNDDKLIEYLKSLNISKIDYLIGTHIHEDHIGSMQFFIKEFEIGKLLLPYNDKATTTYYKNLLKEIINKKLQVEEVLVGDRFNIEDLNFEIMAVDNDMPEEANDASIVIEMTLKENKFLFTGDATTEVESKRNWNDIDILKVGHHGSNTSSSEKFINQVKPEVSIIPVGEDNSYNLPKDKIIKRLEAAGSKVYRTDIDGTIQIISDGTNYEILKIDRSFDGSEN